MNNKNIEFKHWFAEYDAHQSIKKSLELKRQDYIAYIQDSFNVTSQTAHIFFEFVSFTALKASTTLDGNDPDIWIKSIMHELVEHMDAKTEYLELTTELDESNEIPISDQVRLRIKQLEEIGALTTAQAVAVTSEYNQASHDRKSNTHDLKSLMGITQLDLENGIEILKDDPVIQQLNAEY